MRTTVTIDDELLRAAKVLAAQSRRTLGSVLEEALVALLERHRAVDGEPFVHLPTFGEGGLRPGVDLHDKDQLAELLGDDAL